MHFFRYMYVDSFLKVIFKQTGCKGLVGLCCRYRVAYSENRETRVVSLERDQPYCNCIKSLKQLTRTKSISCEVFGSSKNETPRD